MKGKKSWAEKVSAAKPHQVKPAPMDIAGMKAGQIMLVPSPQIIADFIRTIPRGTSMDAKTLRQKLARKYKAEVTCPITTGILLRMVAEAAYEAHERGAAVDEITPVWRVLDENAPTAQRLSCGPAFIAKQRRREGL
jgi:hypothetical protein